MKTKQPTKRELENFEHPKLPHPHQLLNGVVKFWIPHNPEAERRIAQCLVENDMARAKVRSMLNN